MRGVFGIDLTTLLTAHSATLPFVITKCASEVEARGLTTEGIYRLSGFADEIESLKMALDTGEYKIFGASIVCDTFISTFYSE